MRRRIACVLRLVAPYLLIGALALLSAGTISNQLKINAANTRLAMQAANGQKSLTRQCRLVPVAEKMYAWALLNRAQSKFTPEDYALVVSTAQRACPNTRP